MPCLLDMNRKSKAIFKFVWTDFLVPVDVASVVACWCIPVEVYREEKQTGMPSYRLRGCQTNQGAQDGNHICPVQLSSAVRSASGRSFKVLRASRSSSTARTSSCRDNINEPVENNEPTLSTLIWQVMELKETLKLWMLFQVISSPCLEFMKGSTISVDLSRIHRLHMRNGTKSQKRC